MAYYRIKKWAEFQHYKDRSPPWIKLHKDLLTSRTWVMASDSERVLALACMLIAAETDNQIPADPTFLMRRTFLSTEPNLDALVSLQFLEFIEESGDLQADASGCKRTLAEFRPETETETDKRGTSVPAAAAPPSVWDYGRQVLGGSLLGKCIRDHGEERVQEAIIATEGKDAADPKSYLLGILKTDPDATHDEWGNPLHWR